MKQYLEKLPRTAPEGRIIVHNFVRPTRHLGMRGFRAWTDEPSERYELCNCGWASELGNHYRVVDRRQVVVPSP
jgi:hypothetical protein